MSAACARGVWAGRGAGRRLAGLALGAGLALAPGPARAEPGPGGCPERGEAAAGPLAGGTDPVNPADFGAVPEACGGSDLALRLRGGLLDDAAGPGFYGSIVADATLRARRRVSARGWLSLAADLLTFRYVNDAGIASAGVSFGPPTVGYYLTLAATDDLALAGYARALLPLDSARQSGLETGLELGGAGRIELGRRWVLDGGLALAGPVYLTGGQAHAELEPQALAELWFSPRPALGLFAGGTLRVEVAPAASFASAVPRAGGRWAFRGGRWWLAFLGEVPVAGSDRTTALASFFLGWAP